MTKHVLSKNWLLVIYLLMSSIVLHSQFINDQILPNPTNIVVDRFAPSIGGYEIPPFLWIEGHGKPTLANWISEQEFTVTEADKIWFFEQSNPNPYLFVNIPYEFAVMSQMRDPEIIASKDGAHFLRLAKQGDYYTDFMFNTEIFDAEGNRSYLTGFNKPTNLEFQFYRKRDGHLLGSHDTFIYLWQDDFTSQGVSFRWALEDKPNFILERASVSSDGKQVAVSISSAISDQFIVYLWDVDTQVKSILYESEFLPQVGIKIQSLNFRDDNKTLILDGFSWESYNPYRFSWDIDTKALTEESLLNEGLCVFNTLEPYKEPYEICSPDNGATVDVKRVVDQTIVATLSDLPDFQNLALRLSENEKYIAYYLPKDDTKRYEPVLYDKLVVWDVENEREYRRLEDLTGKFVTMNFSPDATKLLLLSPNGTIMVWDLVADSVTNTIPNPHRENITDLVFSSNDQWLLSVGGQVVLWNLKDGTKNTFFDDENLSARQVIFSPDGQTIYVLDAASNLTAWDFETLTPLTTNRVANAQTIEAISTNGELLVLGEQNSLIFWDVATSTIKNSLDNTRPCLIKFTSDDQFVKNCLGNLWKIEDEGALIASWSVAQLPEEWQAWYSEEHPFDYLIYAVTSNKDLKVEAFGNTLYFRGVPR